MDGSPLGLAALGDARSALKVSGLRRLVIGAPTLVSSSTTILGTTSSTVDVVTGTTTATATVTTNGPATVATGNLGTCATAAANGVNPTGCSLPGTPVAVSAGVVNTNVFTNTINAVTPTTSQIVNQLITARWKVAATAGNQFGGACPRRPRRLRPRGEVDAPAAGRDGCTQAPRGR